MRTIQECIAARGWQEITVPSKSSPETEYLVTVPPWGQKEPESVSCECESYEFRGWCRHQHEALATLCHWSELEGEPQTQKQNLQGVCPECGGPTQQVILKS